MPKVVVEALRTENRVRGTCEDGGPGRQSGSALEAAGGCAGEGTRDGLHTGKELLLGNSEKVGNGLIYLPARET